MKNKNACALSGLFLAIIIAAATINYIYVQNTADHISDSLALLPGDLSEASREIAEIRSYWEKRRAFLTLTLPKPDLDNISSLFEEISITSECNNYDEYKISMARLRRAIEDIKDLEEITVENIF